jgi:hypothetical protein
MACELWKVVLIMDIEKSKMNQTKFQYQSLVWIKGEIFLSVQKSCHNVIIFLSFFPSFFLPSKDTFMDDYEGI